MLPEGERLNDILDKVQAYLPDSDLDIIRRAYVFSAKVHQGQLRLSGEPYLTHPLEVASILADLNMDIPTVSTGLLHDTVEDTFTTLENIRELFGDEVTTLVDGVTKISRMSFSTHQERQAENVRKMIIAMAKDIRVILVKLTDRLHNMRTIEYHPREKQEEIAQETMEIYAPLANRLGVGWIKNELEDLAFMTLMPNVYENISKKLDLKRRELKKYSDEVINFIGGELEKNGIDARLQSRIKHVYGIYSKMRDQKIEFDEVYDIIAFRVIVKTLKDCYGSLGTLHSLWKPVPGRFKDYVAMPKPNMYQSLHTTVIGPRGERIEIQIRTEEMHKIAQKGIAGHWRYKEGTKDIKKEDEKRYEWLQRLIEWQNDLKDPTEFLKTIKMDLFPEEVYVFTPKGDVKAFRKGATPIDFAYNIHSDIGNTCVGAKVNGKIVPLKYQLINGDTIEILTKSKQKPSKDWLRYVVTSKAKQRIKHWLIEEQKERSISLGKEILEKEFKKYALNFQKLLRSKKMKEANESLKTKNINDLLSRIANAQITTTQVLEFFVPKEKIEESRRVKKAPEVKRKKDKVPIKKTGVLVRGEGDVMIRYAKCCNPVPGDEIIGFISRGRGVIIHKSDCSNILDFPETLIIEVEWDVKEKSIYSTKIAVLCSDRKGVLASITTAISNAEANISGARISTTEDQKAMCEFELEINDLEHLKKVMRSIESTRDVISVERIR